MCLSGSGRGSWPDDPDGGPPSHIQQDTQYIATGIVSDGAFFFPHLIAPSARALHGSKEGIFNVTGNEIYVI